VEREAIPKFARKTLSAFNRKVDAKGVKKPWASTFAAFAVNSSSLRLTTDD